jgi:VanZ family protein
MLAALFIGGSQNGAGSLFPNPWDKLAHIVFFFCFTIFLSAGFNLSIVTTVILALLIGALDEFHQILLPNRFAGVDDWLADVFGVVLAVGFILSRIKMNKK